MAKVAEIARYLDGLLDIEHFEDSSNNGLQVENSGQVRRVCCGVDASLEFFDEAARRGAELLICHHGLSWKDSLKRVTGLNHRRLSLLIHRDMALYAAHLPLDAHPRHGNNALMARALGLRNVREFGLYSGRRIGLAGRLPAAMPLIRFAAEVSRAVGNEAAVWDFGKRTVRTVAMVVGGGAVGLEEAATDGIDVYLSGEPNLAAWNAARDLGLSAVFAGHYATEAFGVRALAKLVSGKFRIPAEFVDLRIRS